MLNHLQDKYCRVIPNKLLERKDIVKKTIYNPQDPIATLFSAVKELLEFADITGTLYMQDQFVNIAHIIFHSTGKFQLVICVVELYENSP